MRDLPKMVRASAGGYYVHYHMVGSDISFRGNVRMMGSPFVSKTICNRAWGDGVNWKAGRFYEQPLWRLCQWAIAGKKMFDPEDILDIFGR